MSAIANIMNNYTVVSTGPAGLAHPHSAPLSDQTAEGDRLELSGRARSLSGTVTPSSYDLARLHAVRAEIAGGTYETPERIAGTVERLLDVIG